MIEVEAFAIFWTLKILASRLTSTPQLTFLVINGLSIAVVAVARLTITGSALSQDLLGQRAFCLPSGRNLVRRSVRKPLKRLRLVERSLVFRARFLPLPGHRVAFLPLRMLYPGFLP
jgi:hypothetical protein